MLPPKGWGHKWARYVSVEVSFRPSPGFSKLSETLETLCHEVVRLLVEGLLRRNSST
jgi:hypothetical protein